MATHRIKRDSPERIALIADLFGIPADVPLSEWRAESYGGDEALLHVEMVKRVDIATINRILNT